MRALKYTQSRINYPGITVCPTDELELSGSRGTANYVMKWPGAKTESYIKVIHVKKVVTQYDSGEMQHSVLLQRHYF